MKTNYFYAVVFGIMVLTTTSRSQNILFDGDFNETSEIVFFDTLTPPLNIWAIGVNMDVGAETNPSVSDGVAEIQIQNAGYDYPDVQLTQFGFPLNQWHVYQLSFDVRADSDRYLRIFLGEEGGNATNLIGSDKFWYDVTTAWQTISLEFITTSVFDLHKLSFELGANDITTYFDNVILQDLGPVPPEKVVIAGTFQNILGCETDWDPNCGFTELSFDSSTDLYS